MLRAALIAVLLTLGTGVARADTDYFATSGDASTVKVRHEKSRTPGQKALIYGLLGGAGIGLGVGIYFHVDSHAAANEVSEDNGAPTIWNDRRQDIYDRAHSSGTTAIVGYSVCGALAIGAVVASVLTRPGHEVTEVRPQTSLTISHGGAMVAHAWTF
jgi:hypothetical protein